MPRSRPTIRDLLDQYEDASALAELTARAEEALPVVSRMLRGLDSYLSVTALWYVRVLRLVTTDRVGTALAVSRGLSAEYRQAVAWLARGAFRSDDEPRLRTALSHALAKARRAAARNQQPVSVAGVPAFLLEGLGVVASDRASVTLVEETYALASQEVASLWAAGDVGLALFAPDVEPVAAAAAAALLAFTERGGVPTPAAKQVGAWRELCVRIALERPDRGSLSGFGILPPMQFLYAGAPRAAATILVECFRQTEDRDELLTALGGWLRQGPVFGARPTILLSDPGVVALRNELTETLAAGAGDYAHIVTDVLVGLRAPGDTQTERGVVLAALESFLTPMVGADAIGNVLGSLRGLVPFATIAAIAVEDVFRQRVFSSW